MKVSSRGEYGVRAMVALAKNYGHGPMSIAAVSRASSVPMPYLEQLIGPLRRAGLVQSTRGAHGGYQLTTGSPRSPGGRSLSGHGGSGCSYGVCIGGCLGTDLPLDHRL